MATAHLLMIRPVSFGYNAETAVNNAFQIAGNQENVQQLALDEFDNFVIKLQAKGIDVTVIEDTLVPHTPDSIFPNNWVSFHENGMLILYPMFAPNRRMERNQEVLDAIKEKFRIGFVEDLSEYENKGIYLEGTGSMVLDRESKLTYACISPRTDAGVLEEFCKIARYKSVSFTALDEKGNEIYHTNVMMCVADKYVVICLESITNTTEKNKVIKAIQESNKTLIEITFDQMNHFAGNMLQVKNATGERFLVMSTQAYHSLSVNQKHALSQFNEIIHSELTTIETNGGGSARCMMAEVFLPLL